MNMSELPFGSLVTLDILPDLPAGHHDLIISAILLGQLRREEVRVRFAKDFGKFFSHRAAKQIVAKGKSAFGVLAEDVDRQRLHQGMIKRFGLFQRLLGLLPLGNVTPSRDKVSDLAVAVRDRRAGLFLVKYLSVFPELD